VTAIRALAAAGLLAALGAGEATASGVIRVAVVESVRAVELRGADIEVTPLGDGARGGCPHCPASWRADLVRAVAIGQAIEIDGRREAGFVLWSARAIRLNGREYGGRLALMPNGAGLAIVNELPLEEYLVGVVRAELGDRWPREAMRAQAIVARTYAAYHRALNAAKTYHVVATTAHQAFGGQAPASSPVWDAVRDTAGQVLFWEGELFPAFYHADSGGYTEDPRTVFAARNMPALRPVRCEFSVGAPHYQWSLDVSLADLGATLRRHGVDVGTVTAIEITERTPSLRAAVLTLRGTRGSARVRGNDFRRMLGYETFKSTLFAVAVDGRSARFAGRGYGHGVGLSQWGARGMAEQGYGAVEILGHYYPGAALGPLNGR
jgi:stage II sporulation protein D